MIDHYTMLPKGGNTACVEHLLSSPGIDVTMTNGVRLHFYMYVQVPINNKVSWDFITEPHVTTFKPHQI